MPDQIKNIETVEDFSAELKNAGDKLVVVDFFATWCGPCKKIAPIMKELAESNPNVVFLKVDVDEADDLAKDKNISAMPTFQFYKSGVMVKEFKGANEAELRKLVAELQ